MTDAERTLGAMTVVEDADWLSQAGSWVLAGVDSSLQVRRLLPEVFEEYARVFHPARRQAGEPDRRVRALDEQAEPFYAEVGGVLWREVRWRQVAEANGKVSHPAMQWSSIVAGHTDDSGTQPGLWDRPPQSDSLPLRLTRVLCEVLAEFTLTPDRVWCGVWEGYGFMVGLRSDSTLPRLTMPSRPMIVACGPLDAVPEKSFTDGFTDARELDPVWGAAVRYQSPSLWWPDDRAWCVATDVEMQTTYLGAPAACVNRLLADDRLENTRVSPDQDITWESDAINGPVRL